MEDISKTYLKKEDISEKDKKESPDPLPKITKDKSLTMDEDGASKIPLPKINFYTELQYKQSDRKNKALLKLLHLSSTKSKKSFPKTREQQTNTTLQEKLTEVYLKSQRRSTIMKQMNFMKNDFLKELVMKEDLKYFILEILPKNECFYLIDNVRVPTVIEGTVYEDIQNEKLSIATYKEISKMMSLYSLDINEYMHNHHIILNIRKYVSQAADAEPVFSSFILLKPTNMLLLKLARPSEDDGNNDPLVPDLESLKKESKLFSEVSGPLYLDTSPLGKEFINFLKEYRYEFDSVVSNQHPVKDTSCKINLPPLFETIKELSSKIRCFKELMNPLGGKSTKITGNVIECQELLHTDLKEFLAERQKPENNILKEFAERQKPENNILNEFLEEEEEEEEFQDEEEEEEFQDPGESYQSLEEEEEKFQDPGESYQSKLIEIYAIKFAMISSGKSEPTQCFISVFQNHDNTFKFCTTIRLFQFYIPRYPEAIFMDGNKEELDKYISSVLLYLNRISACGLEVTLSDLNLNTTSTFYTGDRNKIEEKNKRTLDSACCFQNDALPDVRKNYLDAVGYHESRESEQFISQQVLIDGRFQEVLIRVKKMPYVLDVYQKLEHQQYNEEEMYIEACSLIENGNERIAFEAHKFEKSHRYPYFTHAENGDKIRYQFYPSLHHVYEWSESDFQDSEDLTLTDDIKAYLDLCSKGDMRIHF